MKILFKKLNGEIIDLTELGEEAILEIHGHRVAIILTTLLEKLQHKQEFTNHDATIVETGEGTYEVDFKERV